MAIVTIKTGGYLTGSNLLSLVAMLLLSQLAFAHTKLSESIPAANAKLDTPPNELILTYSTDVRLIRVKLTNSDGKATEFGFKASATMDKQFKYPLPILDQGSYSVSWSILGADGHKMTGDFGFTID